MNKALYFSDIKLAYPDKDNRKKQHIVLNDINFKISPHHILGIIGESGSGKTTLARVISGLCPTNAKIISGEYYYETNTLHQSISKSINGIKICLLMQDPFLTLNPSLKIRHQLRYCLKTKHKDFYNQVQKLLDEVGINNPEDVLDKYPSELSGGINQRISIAMGLATQPDIIIFVEPTSAIDANNIEIVLKLITKLTTQHNLSTIIISHDINSVRKVADEIIVMNDGRIVEYVEKLNGIWNFEHSYSIELLNAYDFEEFDKTYDNGKCLLTLADVSKSFNGKVIFDKLSFNVYKGETLGIVGSSGSGKSTIAKLIFGIYQADSGQILKLDNTNIEMVFQNAYASLDPAHRVRKILNENFKIKHKTPLTDVELLDLIKHFPLPEDILERKVDELSGGQRQMIAVIRALASSPDLIIFDEPTSALDTITQKKLINLIMKIKEIYSLTYILISHDLKLIESISSKIVHL